VKQAAAAFGLACSLGLQCALAVTLFAGSGAAGSSGDGGPATRAQLNNPFGLVRGPDGALWFADYSANVIRRVGKDGVITTVVGNGTAGYSGDGGGAAAASLTHPHEIRFDRAGNLFIADTGNHVIRRYDVKSGLLTTYAGTGRPGNSGDGGPATNAELKDPMSLQFSPSGSDLFIADVSSHVIRRVDVRTGLITTFAGSGNAGPTPDGAPIAGTPLNGPRSLTMDRSGNLWLVTREGNQVLRLDLRTGVIRQAIGTGEKGFTGNGGPARQAILSGPKNIAAGPATDIYLADTENHAIRRLDVSHGTIELVTGTGTLGTAVSCDPLQTQLARPHGIWVDPDGGIFVSDTENHRILYIAPARLAAARGCR
jgi:streptogramin lyase